MEKRNGSLHANKSTEKVFAKCLSYDAETCGALKTLANRGRNCNNVSEAATPAAKAALEKDETGPTPKRRKVAAPVLAAAAVPEQPVFQCQSYLVLIPMHLLQHLVFKF